MRKLIWSRMAAAGVLLFAGAASGGAQDPTTETFVAIADTLIQEDVNSATSSLNRGTEPSLDVGMSNSRRQRMLVRFDISSISFGADVQSADLSLRRLARSGFANDVPDKNTYAFRMLRDWSETEASWDSSVLGSVQWESPGADGPTDRAATATDFDPTETTFSHWDVTSDVQLIADGAAEDFGWMLIGPESDTVSTIFTRFATREYDTTSSSIWPTLTVTYVPEPSTYALSFGALALAVAVYLRRRKGA